MMDKKGAKGLAAIIVSKKPVEGPEEEAGEEMDGEGFAAAAKEAFAALKEDDESKFTRALKNAVRMCDE